MIVVFTVNTNSLLLVDVMRFAILVAFRRKLTIASKLAATYGNISPTRGLMKMPVSCTVYQQDEL